MTRKKSYGLGLECVIEMDIYFAMCKWAAHQGLVRRAWKEWAGV